MAPLGNRKTPRSLVDSHATSELPNRVSTSAETLLRPGRLSPPSPLTPSPSPPLPVERNDGRIVAAWDAWLRALATDADAALAAANAYENLDDQGRHRWLRALTHDAPRLEVPLIALYAPLLSVETDRARITEMHHALGMTGSALIVSTCAQARALRGVENHETRIVALVWPVYLSFVRLVVCKFHIETGFLWARHEPLLHDEDAPHGAYEFDGVWLEPTPLTPVIEEVAHAVLAHRRRGQPLPEALHSVVTLFSMAATLPV